MAWLTKNILCVHLLSLSHYTDTMYIDYIHVNTCVYIYIYIYIYRYTLASIHYMSKECAHTPNTNVWCRSKIGTLSSCLLCSCSRSPFLCSVPCSALCFCLSLSPVLQLGLGNWRLLRCWVVLDSRLDLSSGVRGLLPMVIGLAMHTCDPDNNMGEL